MIFLIQSPHAWQGVWQRPHHLASRFVRAGHFVRYVQPRYIKWLAGEAGRFFDCRSDSDGADVRAVTLFNPERLAPIRRLNERRLALALNAPVHSAARGPRVLWLYNPHEGRLAGSVPHDLLVYDIMDEYRGFPWSPPNVEAEEAELLRRADWVFAGTRALYDAKKDRAEGRIECVLSGVEAERFARPAEGDPARSIPPDLAPLRERYARLLGYAGTIDLRIDRKLLAESAARHPDWGFVLLGPAGAGAAELRALPNIHLLGQKDYGDLPAYYHAWDAALVPFVENELTRHVNPTKILEYAAAGLPVVTRALPDVERYYAGGAWLYRTGEEFESACRGALGLDAGGADDRRRRLEAASRWADERGWSAIAETALARLESLLGSAGTSATPGA